LESSPGQLFSSPDLVFLDTGTKSLYSGFGFGNPALNFLLFKPLSQRKRKANEKKVSSERK
jgi:hypothetical protein